MNTTSNQSVGQWQRRFIEVLFQTILALRGRVNFTNLARYCSLSEQTFRRNFGKSFDWLRFNPALISLANPGQKDALIAAIDCTFLPKSGKAAYGLDVFGPGRPARRCVGWKPRCWRSFMSAAGKLSRPMPLKHRRIYRQALRLPLPTV